MNAVQDLKDKLHDVWVSAYHSGLEIATRNSNNLTTASVEALKHAGEVAASYRKFFTDLYQEKTKTTEDKQ